VRGGHVRRTRKVVVVELELERSLALTFHSLSDGYFCRSSTSQVARERNSHSHHVRLLPN
jgi:hypothetical protein